jgi:ubiquinone/menaquinone biosynthesis C-methylase UbiE
LQTFNEDWEREALNWAQWARTPGHDSYWRHSGPPFFELLPPSGRATLDLGCGEGRVSRDLKARGYAVTGIDASPTLIGLARDTDPDGEYVLGDAAALPFADGSFDLVVAFNTLMDIQDMHAAVREAARVLEPRGHFCIAITHPLIDAGRFTRDGSDAPFVIEGTYFGKRRPWYYGRAFERAGLTMTFNGWCYSLEEYARALEDAGFVIEALREPQDPDGGRMARLPNFLHLRALKPE